MKTIQTTAIYSRVDKAVKDGFTTISAQGSSRSSKTYNILIWLIFYLLQNPNTRLSIVRATLPALKGSVFIDFKEILYKMGIFNEKALNKSDFVYHFPNGSWVEFFSTDSEQKLRGRKRDVLYVNEANELKFIEWQQLKMRTTKFAIVDYNPSFSDDHWLCELNKDKRTHHFISTYKDNPFLEQTIIDEIESLQHKNKSLWQVYGLGQQAMIEGLVFEKIEIVDEIPQWAKKRGLGMDFGYTQDPTAIVECAVVDNDLYINEICYKTKMLASDIINELKPLKMKVISESADPRLIQEIANAGILIYPVQKYQGSVMGGITKMLGMNIKVTKKSINAIKEFKNYTYEQNKEGKWLNEPIDAFNHIIDAVRYYVLGELLGRVMLNESVSKDDLGIF
ncbi:PBSX family phage terminase large subunit [Capnocytophaga canis]|uniref:PBSX family phage terminase large subunit n=1 Tax=Capnocytophaga canis TaxID=1848903 RepID=UPI001ACDAB43|nr:PBSX family phage terminase large subunit [Capnocytophaga canis]GIM60080.1 PBSX family phage terminase large subunit [Capnocytophaga canis]